MVLYFFPPLGGVSMSRNVRNVEHLPRFGWTPVVLTPTDGAYSPKDPASLALVAPDIRVIRTRSVEPGHLRALLAPLGKAMRRRFRENDGRNRRRVRCRPRRATGPAPADTRGARRPELHGLRRLVFFPDDRLGWLPFALFAAIRAHRRAPFDALYSTSSPITSHLVCATLKHLTGLPWVAEFRDPWVGNALAAPLPWLHRRLQVRLERWIVHSADRVVCLSPGITRLYRRRYPDVHGIETITNGYDRAETRPRRTSQPGRRFRIVYTGTLDRALELETFLLGVERLVARRPDLIGRFEVTFYGEAADSCAAVADRFLAERRLGDLIRFPGFVPRQVALDAVADADAALILLGEGPGMGLFVGGKLFDYLGQNRQILAMLPRGDTREILEQLDWGVIADPDPPAVERAIERLLTLPPPARPADPDGRFDRVALAARLAEVLDQARIAADPPAARAPSP
jgi:glycosyltransferase involved in cell wall biosynthesis